jgi:uncharacterized protein (DUF885 family)
VKAIYFLAVLICLSAAGPGAATVDDDFEQLTAEILNDLQQFNPVHATEMGIHEYDHLYTDYSRRSVGNMIARLRDYEQDLYKYRNRKLSDNNRLNLKLLKSNVDIALQDLDKIEWYRKNPYLYVSDAVNGIYFLLISDDPPAATRNEAVIARLNAIPELLEQAEDNLRKPVPVYIRLARQMLESGNDFFVSVGKQLASEAPEKAGQINEAVTAATEAMRRFNLFLGQAEPGDEKGFAIGEKDFNYKLEHQYFLGFSADSLLHLGEGLYNHYDSLYRAANKELDTLPKEADAAFTVDCIGRQDILEYYQWEVEQARRFLTANALVSIPDDIGRCQVVETPPFLVNVISSVAYQPPGPFGKDMTGHFYVRPLPDSLTEDELAGWSSYIMHRKFRGSVVHEAYPGHHLQLQMAARSGDDLRKWQFNLMLIEGWALYCEEMMYDRGYYGFDRTRYPRVLNGIRFRAARIILDVRLHTGRMTVDEAIKWLAERFDMSEDYARIEVERYTLEPTVPMSYLAGKLKLLELRRDYKKQRGELFSLKEFHDRLLSEGSIPFALIREIWGM